MKSPNRPSDPQERIRKITNMYPNSPQSPFYDPENKLKTPFAILTIKRQALRGPQCPNGIVSETNDNFVNSVGVFDPTDLSDVNIRNRFLEPSLKTKKGKKKAFIKFIGNIQFIKLHFFINFIKIIFKKCQIQIV